MHHTAVDGMDLSLSTYSSIRLYLYALSCRNFTYPVVVLWKNANTSPQHHCMHRNRPNQSIIRQKIQRLHRNEQKKDIIRTEACHSPGFGTELNSSRWEKRGHTGRTRSGVYYILLDAANVDNIVHNTQYSTGKNTQPTACGPEYGRCRKGWHNVQVLVVVVE